MKRIDVLLSLVLALALIATLVAVAVQTVRSGEKLLLPELRAEQMAAARSVAGQVEEALRYGIPFDRLSGVEEVLESALVSHPGLGTIALERDDGRRVAEASRITQDDAPLTEARVPIVYDGTQYGTVAVATETTVARDTVRNLWIDGVILLAVAVLASWELTTFAFTTASAASFRALVQRIQALRSGNLRPHPPVTAGGVLAKRCKEIDGRIEKLRKRQETLLEAAVRADAGAELKSLEKLDKAHGLSAYDARLHPSISAIRAPVFLFFFAEELTRPFLPSVIESVARPIAGIPTQLVIAAPMVIFMAIVALAQPGLNDLTERYGRTRSLRLGAMVAAIGYVGTALSGTLVELTVFRIVTACGFATVFVAAQGFIVDRTLGGSRARGIGFFVSAIMVAMLCGPPVGGIVADRLGTEWAFFFAALMAMFAYLAAAAGLPARDPKPQTPRFTMARGAQKPLRLGDIATALCEPRLMLLVMMCALPAKIILIGLCFYYLPLALADTFDADVIGRVLMLYGLAMLVVVPAVSGRSDAKGMRWPYVVVGGLISGSAPLAWFLFPQPWGAAAMVLLVGIGQGISTTPQSALVGEISRKHLPHLSEASLYGVFRLFERLGAAIGPLMVGALWAAFSGDMALVITGGLVVIGAVVFGLGATFTAPPTTVATAKD